jgi:hypothetical protein
MKEELRAGRSLRASIDAGFSRAWTSIKDSNISTLITCAILFYFGMSFGASVIQGFALTLAIGVLVSMVTAIFVSRTFLHVVIDSGAIRSVRWYGYGIPEPAEASRGPMGRVGGGPGRPLRGSTTSMTSVIEEEYEGAKSRQGRGERADDSAGGDDR